MYNQNIRAHSTMHQSVLDESYLRHLHWEHCETQDSKAEVEGGVKLSPEAPSRGAVAWVPPQELPSRKGRRDTCTDELHWQRIAVEEHAHLRQLDQEQRHQRRELLNQASRAQLVTAEEARRHRDIHIRLTERATETMRDAWLVRPPPFHFERQLTNHLVDHGEQWSPQRQLEARLASYHR